MTPQQALAKAKIMLMSKPDSVFFSTICFSLIHKFEDDCPTAMTDGKTVIYGTKFFMGLTPEERLFLMLHETLHVAYMHMSRKSHRDMGKWNVACDYAINIQLKDRGFKMLPVGLCDEKYRGMSAEEIYAKLPEGTQGNPVLLDLQEPGGGAEKNQLEQDVQNILVRAAIQSKMAGDKPGTIPGDIQVMLDRLLDPKLPWQRILQKYLKSYSKSDYTMKKPNRRFFPKWYLPSMRSEALMDLTIAMDLSGSVSDTEAMQMISELHSIFKMMKPKKITLLPFDTKIRGEYPIKSLLELNKAEFTGRGGTDIKDLVQWANTTNPQLLLIFTDGEFRFPEEDIKSDVIWLIHNNKNFTAPYGKVIHYEM